MHKRPVIVLFLATLFAVALFAGQTTTPAESPGAPAATPTIAANDQSLEPVASDLELGGELLATLQASNFVYCKNIGGACTSNSQCGNLGTCVNNVCQCECNYGAICNAKTNCGYAAFCNPYNNRCACY